MVSITASTAVTATHGPGGGRFFLVLDGHEAELTYQLLSDRLMVINHTGVPEAIGGRGVAGVLVKAAFEHAREHGWTVRPACSYAATWAVRHHADYADVIEH